LLFDEDRDGLPLVWFAVLDECTRECLALTVHRRVQSQETVSTFEAAFNKRQQTISTTVRCDNAPVWKSFKLLQWAEAHGLQLCSTDRGSPWQNGIVEAFFSRLRAELLNHTEMADLAEARVEAAMWRRIYNTIRPHSALGYKTPEAYRESLREEQE